MSALLFFFPGALLICSDDFRKKSVSEFAVHMLGFSLSFFIVAAWFAKYTGISLLGMTYCVFIVSIILIIFEREKYIEYFKAVAKDEYWILLLFVLVFGLRLMPFFLQIAPAGADMSMHSYLARLILDNDRIPSSYEPFLPVQGFGAYPSGFPIISAIYSLLSGMPVYRSALLLSCLTHFLFAAGLYVFLLRFFDKRASAAAAVLTSFLTRSPQWFIRWGGNPSVLSFFFMIVAFSLIVELKNGSSKSRLFVASLALAAGLITHTILFYIGSIMIFTYLVASNGSYRKRVPDLVMIGVLFALLSLPYLIGLNPSVTASTIENLRGWQNEDIKSVYYDIAAGIPFLALSALGLVRLFFRGRRVAAVFLSITAVLILLIINSRFWVLPFSYLLYPGRIAMAVVVPLSVFFASICDAFISRRNWITLISLAVLAFALYFLLYLYGSVSMCSVTRADLEAFNWIDKTVNVKAVFANNYGDAGLWIPAMIGRKITSPHSFLVLLPEGDKRAKTSPDYIFIGKKAVYRVEYKPEDLEKSPGRYRRVYLNDGAQVWKVL